LKSADEIRESKIHFELYRYLMNVIESLKTSFNGIRYLSVKPEMPVDSDSADLVIEAEINGRPSIFLVIEVKRRGRPGLTVFGSEAEKQACGYAERLGSPYYAITDGRCLRLFKTPNELIGNYEFSLYEDSVTKFLEELTALYLRKTQELSFNPIKDPIKEIEKRTHGFTKKLLGLLEKLSSEGRIRIKQKGYVKYIGIGGHPEFLRIGIYDDSNDNYIDVRLENLRKALGGNYSKLLSQLSNVPGFKWVLDKESANKPFVWKKLKDIAIETSNDIESACQDLESWILNLEEKLAL